MWDNDGFAIPVPVRSPTWWFVDKKGSWKTDRVGQCRLHCIQIIESNGGIWQWSSQPKLTGLQQFDISCFTALHYIRPERKARIFFTKIPSHNTRIYPDPRSIWFMRHLQGGNLTYHPPNMLKQTSNVSCITSISFHHCFKPFLDWKVQALSSNWEHGIFRLMISLG